MGQSRDTLRIAELLDERRPLPDVHGHHSPDEPGPAQTPAPGRRGKSRAYSGIPREHHKIVRAVRRACAYGRRRSTSC
jgi:hypothetical protein